MAQFTEGQIIRLPCKVSPGPFSEEPLVTFETVNGEITGFVSEDDVDTDDRGNNFLRGIVHAVHGDIIDVWVRGSFFTTNGLAAVRETMVAAA